MKKQWWVLQNKATIDGGRTIRVFRGPFLTLDAASKCAFEKNMQVPSKTMAYYSVADVLPKDAKFVARADKIAMTVDMKGASND